MPEEKSEEQQEDEEGQQEEGQAQEKKAPGQGFVKRNAYAVAVVALVVGLVAGGSISTMFFQSDPTGLAVLQTGSGNAVPAALSSEEVASKVSDFVLDNLLMEGFSLELSDIKKNGESIYELIFSISDGEQAQPVVVFATADGENIVIGNLFDLDTPLPKPEPVPEQPQEDSFSEADIEKLSQFVLCLKENGMVIYGANWCGWTKKLVDSLGGFETVAPIYINCEVETELCNEEGIEGFPTIKVNGELYNSGDKSMEALAAAVGCEAPALEGNAPQDSSAGSC